MNHQLPSFNYSTIKQLLVSRLQLALDLYICDSSALTQLNSSCIRLAKEQQRVLYVCAIALRLSPVLKLPALEIANSLARFIYQQIDVQDFLVQVVPPGWIYLEVSAPTLAAWLQHLTQAPLPLSNIEGKFLPSSLIPQRASTCARYLRIQRSPSSLFPIQYAHARCCSLLQLAHREKLITLKPTADSSAAFWLVVAPNPIPWLNLEQKFCLFHPSEKALIIQLLALLDDLYCHFPSHQAVDWYKAALNLSQAFQTFHSHCRIWGEVKNQNIQLAQARLGLVSIAQSVLRLLSQERLGIISPLEL